MPQSKEILFILSDTRSGSTLLDQLLGAHPGIASVGELIWLRAYVREDRAIYDPAHPLKCSCGATVSDCAFWRQVAAVLGRPLDDLQLSTRDFGRRWAGRHRHRLVAGLWGLPVRFLDAFPGSYRRRVVQTVFSGPRLARDSLALFDAIFEVSKARYVVDASKSATRFRSIYRSRPANVRAIVLGRDYRAVVHSKMRRGRSLEVAASGWRKSMTRIECLTRDLPPGCSIRIKYENLCEQPEKELARICAFLGLEYSSAMLERHVRNLHHIGGSPSQFDPARAAIVMDRSHEGAFSREALERMHHLVGDVAKSWDY